MNGAPHSPAMNAMDAIPRATRSSYTPLDAMLMVARAPAKIFLVAGDGDSELYDSLRLRIRVYPAHTQQSKSHTTT